MTGVYEDSEKKTWITTLNNGILYSPSISSKSMTTNEGLSNNYLLNLLLFDKNLIAIDDNGTLNLLNTDSLEQKPEIFERPSSTKGSTGTVNFDQYNGVLYADIKNETYTFSKGKYRENFKELHPLYFFSKDSALFMDETPQIIMLVKNKENEIIVPYSKTINLIYDRFKYFFTDKNNNWYMYGKEGIININSHNNNNNNNSSFKSIAFHGQIKLMLNHPRFDFIAATQNKGILFMKNQEFVLVSKKHGIASDQITDLFVDLNESIWVGTSNGISIIDSNFNITNLRVEDGLISNEVTDIVVNNEHAFVATKKGLTILNKSEIHKDLLTIPVVFKSISLHDNREVTPLNNSISLDYNEPMLEIKFVGISYISMGRIKYKYRLNPFENWQYTNNTELTFINLASGDYQLEIYASNGENEWSSKPAKLYIHVAYPFWRSVGFIVFMVLGSSILLFGIYRFTLIRIKSREKIKRQVQNLRFEALNAQMNPHFIFNSLNSIQHFIMTNEKRESTRYLSKFAKLMRKTLDHSQQQNITLKEELEALELYLELESLRFENLVSYEINIAPTIDTNHVILPALLIQPIVENSILHGLRPKKEYGHIKISITDQKSMLSIIITDDGVGRVTATVDKTNRHDSQGSILTKERVQLFAKDYHAESEYKIIDRHSNGSPIGTEVRIKIPLIIKSLK